MRVALLLFALGGCQGSAPVGQIALHLDTDAFIGPDQFDTLRLEIFPPGASAPCAGCTRTFTVRPSQFRAGQISFGIPIPPRQPGYRVRARLYPARATISGDPPVYEDGAGAVIEAVAALPSVREEGILERRLFLPTDSVGLPRGTLAEPIETEPGRFEASREGTWGGARTVPCKGIPRAGEVCVPGGAFFMGHALAWERGLVGIQRARTRLRLVVVSPFFADADLLSVGKTRETNLLPDGTYAGGNGGIYQDFCTYTLGPGPNEALPVNCVYAETAAALCAARGSELLSEAQWEFMASARTGRLYAWGEDPTLDCDEVVFGRTGWGMLLNNTAPCRPILPFGGPLAVGSLAPPRRDRLELDGGVLFDLAGNMSTYTRDRFNRAEEPCWSRGGVYVDPVCTEAGVDGSAQSVRGGSWNIRSPLPAAERLLADDGSYYFSIGVRCGRSAQ